MFPGVGIRNYQLNLSVKLCSVSLLKGESSTFQVG
jgi:hypothetical protein